MLPECRTQAPLRSTPRGGVDVAQWQWTHVLRSYDMQRSCLQRPRAGAAPCMAPGVYVYPVPAEKRRVGASKHATQWRCEHGDDSGCSTGPGRQAVWRRSCGAVGWETVLLESRTHHPSARIPPGANPCPWLSPLSFDALGRWTAGLLDTYPSGGCANRPWDPAMSGTMQGDGASLTCSLRLCLRRCGVDVM